MSLLDKIKALFRKEKVEIKELEEAQKLRMNTAEFEEFLRQGGKADYATMRIENLEDRIKSIAEHPIQKKIIDIELLTRIIEILKDINEKVSVIPDIKSRTQTLPTLQEMASVLQKAMPERELEGRERLEKIAGSMESELDENYVEILSGGELTAEEVAGRLNVSRNTASERLNKLVEIGKARKARKNRKVFFSLASHSESSAAG